MVQCWRLQWLSWSARFVRVHFELPPSILPPFWTGPAFAGVTGGLLWARARSSKAFSMNWRGVEFYIAMGQDRLQRLAQGEGGQEGLVAGNCRRPIVSLLGGAVKAFFSL